MHSDFLVFALSLVTPFALSAIMARSVGRRNTAMEVGYGLAGLPW